MPPVFVFKDKDVNVWRWTCRQCSQSEWRGRHDEALSDAQKHIRSHESFGFKR
jgi:hypothetical protein